MGLVVCTRYYGATCLFKIIAAIAAAALVCTSSRSITASVAGSETIEGRVKVISIAEHYQNNNNNNSGQRTSKRVIVVPRNLLLRDGMRSPGLRFSSHVFGAV